MTVKAASKATFSSRMCCCAVFWLRVVAVCDLD
jgi:hypothetical protein